MAIAIGVNSNVTLEEAEAYFADRLDVAAWVEASATQKPQALVTATMLLDTLNWDGFATSVSQLLAFPRCVEYFDPRLGRHINCKDETPTRVKHATFELAYHLLNNDGLLDDTGSVDSLELGPISLRTVKNASVIPATVKRIIKPLLINNGSVPVWRAW